jgi:hypothetical protein
MPELYGQPRKDELRAKIRELDVDLAKELTAHRNTRESLRFAQARIQVLEEKLQRIEQRTREMLTDVGAEVTSDAVCEKYMEIREREREERTREFKRLMSASEAS